MYKKLFIAIDNSRHSDYCINLGIELSRKFNSLLVGCHVYDASLHQRRFRDMEKGVPHKGLLLEGKNYFEIIKEVQGNHYDLVIMGAQGLASVDNITLGSVCERVVRRIKTDILVVKNGCFWGSAVVDRKS